MMKRHFLAILISTALVLTNSFVCLLAQPNDVFAQSGQTANPQTNKIKKQVRDLGVGQDVTVILLSGKSITVPLVR